MKTTVAEWPFQVYWEGSLSYQKMIRSHPDWVDQEIANAASKELSMDVSRSAVARIRSEKEDKKWRSRKRSKAELLEDAYYADALGKVDFDKKQLEFDMIWDQEIKEAAERCTAEGPIETEDHFQKIFIDRLSCGEHSNFAGQFMHHCFLDEIGFDEITSVYPVNPNNAYQSRDILSTIFHSINLGLPSIEGLKLINPVIWDCLSDTIEGLIKKRSEDNFQK